MQISKVKTETRLKRLSDAKQTVDKITVLEARLQLLVDQQKDVTVYDQSATTGLFPRRSICLYYYLLGDAYRHLTALSSSNQRSETDAKETVSGFRPGKISEVLAPSSKSHLIGNDYKNLDAEFRSQLAFRAGLKEAQESLSTADPLLLMCAYGYCELLLRPPRAGSGSAEQQQQQLQRRERALKIATRAFEAACLHTNDIPPHTLQLLQRLRDDILSQQPQNLKLFQLPVAAQSETNSAAAATKGRVSNSSMCSKNSDDTDSVFAVVDPTANNSLTGMAARLSSQHRTPPLFASSRLPLTAASSAAAAVEAAAAIDSATGNYITQEQQQLQNRNNPVKVNTARSNINTARSSFAANNGSAHDGSGGEHRPQESLKERRDRLLVLRLRRAVSLPVPVPFESLTSSAALLKAVERIFRAYVRGSALPAQLAGGGTVEFDGSNMSYRAFILHGPYLGFSGFVQFVLDFNVALPPQQQQSSALADAFEKKFKVGGKAAADNSADANASGAISMLDCALLFLEASKTSMPALVLKKFRNFYAGISAAQQQQQNPQYSASALNAAERQEQHRPMLSQMELWPFILDCLQSRVIEQWDIRSGLNFAQFMDCLGKIAVIAYDNPRFREVLPTAAHRVEHFLSAHLGLVDPRKWQYKVDAKLRKAKAAIRRAGSGGANPTTSAAAFTRGDAATGTKK